MSIDGSPVRKLKALCAFDGRKERAAEAILDTGITVGPLCAARFAAGFAAV
jgi:hypothetical protein